MFIKRLLARLVEKITGRKCRRCAYNKKGYCIHPDGKMFKKCWGSITLPGFKKRPPRFMRTDDGLAREDMTSEEQHQLNKIKAMLQEAGCQAQDGGLLEGNHEQL